MRPLFFTIPLLFSFFTLLGQAPDAVSYQAVIRDSDNEPVSLTAIGLRLSILQGDPPGAAVYVEVHSPMSNANGLISVNLGEGAVESGDFGGIDWGAGPYSIKMEADPTGGANYSITGTSQILAVPYAIYSSKADSAEHAQTAQTAQTAQSIAMNISSTGDTLYLGNTGGYVIVDGISAQNHYQYPSGFVHCSSNQPTSKADVTSTTGYVWMGYNLGASRVATSSTDSLAYGDLYQWGRFAEGHQCRSSATTTTKATTVVPKAGNVWDGKYVASGSSPYNWLATPDDNLWQGVDGANNPCPEGYRVPTESEWEIEREAFMSNDSDGAFASPLKLPISGYRFASSGNPSLVGSYGFYWSSSVSGSNNARNLGFFSSGADLYSGSRGNGIAVRCLKEFPQPAYDEGTVHCTPGDITKVKGVISTTGQIWMDRNLGASRAAISSTDEESYGDFYQWGRFADGHQCRSSDTTSSKATTVVPNAGNVWDGKFVTSGSSPYDWLATPDDNLWQGVDGTNNPCPEGYRVPTESEWEMERQAFGSNDSDGAFASPLKLPVSGSRLNSSGDPFYVGSYGLYWSSSVSGSNARHLLFYSGDAVMSSYYRADGLAVRCLKD